MYLQHGKVLKSACCRGLSIVRKTGTYNTGREVLTGNRGVRVAPSMSCGVQARDMTCGSLQESPDCSKRLISLTFPKLKYDIETQKMWKTFLLSPPEGLKMSSPTPMWHVTDEKNHGSCFWGRIYACWFSEWFRGFRGRIKLCLRVGFSNLSLIPDGNT